MIIVQKPSSHFDERKADISMIVLHATATNSLEETFSILIDQEEKPRVSCHYVIDRDGVIYQLVEESKRAWHAGIACWGEIKEDVNSHSIGIEFQCPATGAQTVSEFTPAQIKAGMALCADIMERYQISSSNVVAHSDIAPGRKFDPGMTFPWEMFWAVGLADNPVRRPLDVK